MASFDSLLQALMSTDNNMRSQAEAAYNSSVESNLLGTLQNLLVKFSDKSADMVMRSFSGILLRRIVEKFSHTFAPDTVVQLRAGLLSLWSSEDNAGLLRHLSHVIAQSSVVTIDDRTGEPAVPVWSDLIPTILAHAQAVPNKIIPTLALLEILADYCPDDITSNLQQLGGFLGAQLGSSDLKIQIASARATGSCIVAIEDEPKRNEFKPALQSIITVLGAALSNGDEQDATHIMEHLVSVAQDQPIFFRGHLDFVVAAMLQIAACTSLDENTRNMALELIVTIAETAPALARKCNALVQGIIPVLFNIMLEMDGDEGEFVRTKYTNELPDENCAAGDSALERLAAGMGGRVLCQPILTHVQQFASNPKREYRRAAVAGLHRLAEGATKEFKAFLDQGIQFLTGALADPSSRVKYEAIACIGRLPELYTDKVPELITAFLPLLTDLLVGAGVCDRVRGHAASALINLTNPADCESEVLMPYLDTILRALTQCLQGAAIEVQSVCLSLLGGVAQAAEGAFTPYYASLIPGIKSILANAVAPELAQLRGKAMECVGLIGDAVGAQVFAPDALEIMTLLNTALMQDVTNDNTFEFILPACARISKALGASFEPFLSMAMEPILRGAAQDVQFSITDATEDEVDEDVEEDDNTKLVSKVMDLGQGNYKRVTLNHYAVQQRQQAARLLFEFASSMKGHLKGYLPRAMQAILPLVTCRHSSETRAASTGALSKLFEAYLDAAKLGFVSAGECIPVMNACTQALLTAIRGESNVDARQSAAEALGDVFKACYESGDEDTNGIRSNFVVTPALSDCSQLVANIMKLCAESVERRKAKEDAIAGNEGLDEEDKEAFDEELEIEEDTLKCLVDSMGQLLKLHKEAFMPIFDSHIAAAFSVFLSPQQPATLQIVSICMIDDAIEFGGAPAHKYIPQALSVFVRNITHSNPVLRQCSVYGIAQAARVCPDIFAQHVSTIVPALVALVRQPNARDEDNEAITENAIYCLGVLCAMPQYKCLSWGIDAKDVTGLWLQSLPLRQDEIEAKVSATHLCDLIERNDENTLGGGSLTNLPTLLRIIATILASTTTTASPSLPPSSDDIVLAHPVTCKRLQSIVKSMAQQVPQQMQAAFASLPSPLQTTLTHTLSV